jgi:hypothetical protein
MPTIKIEGQTIKGDSVGITDEIANDDELLKAALAPTWPDVRTASFKREGGKEGKELVVTVQKKAGTKGVNNVVEVEEALERLQAREEAEAERIRKLEDIALAAEKLILSFWEFDGDPSCISGEVQVLGDAIEELGEGEIARIREDRRATVSREELTPGDRERLRIAESREAGDGSY